MIPPSRKWLRMNEHVYFPKKTRRYLLLLAALYVLLCAIPFFLSQQDDSLLLESIVSDEVKKESASSQFESLDYFDPNTASADELMAQGLGEYATQNLIKYRLKGWRAYKPEDMLKVYGIDSSNFKKIKDRIAIVKVVKKEASKGTGKSKIEIVNTPFDPNTSTYQELRSQGFSKYAANSLLAFIESGARIESKEDLKRVYGVDENLFASLEDRIVIEEELITKEEEVASITISENIVLPNFDPNLASLEDLVQQGLDKKTAYSLINYRGTGAVFRKKEQLLSIYGITDSVFASIEGRIVITIDTTLVLQYDNSVDNVLADKDTLVYNLNTITQAELLEIDGIGQYYSKAITAYRSKLGGYYNVDQLLEVPAFRKEHFDKLKNRFKLDGNISRISPVAEFKELLKHPYVDYELAKKFKTMSVFDMEERIQEMIRNGQIEDRLIPYLQKY